MTYTATDLARFLARANNHCDDDHDDCPHLSVRGPRPDGYLLVDVYEGDAPTPAVSFRVTIEEAS